MKKNNPTVDKKKIAASLMKRDYSIIFHSFSMNYICAWKILCEQPTIMI